MSGWISKRLFLNSSVASDHFESIDKNVMPSRLSIAKDDNVYYEIAHNGELKSQIYKKFKANCNGAISVQGASSVKKNGENVPVGDISISVGDIIEIYVNANRYLSSAKITAKEENYSKYFNKV